MTEERKMPNKIEHAIGSGIVGLAVYALYTHVEGKTFDWGTAFLSTLGGAFLGTLPDMIEPSKILGPTHRGLAHSWLLLGLSTIGVGKAFENQNLSTEQKYILTWLASTYGTHLVMDAGTPAGLPTR